MAGTQPEQLVGSGPTAAAISNLVVRLMSDCTGRGPTMARTHIAGELITVVLQDTMTKGERSLVQDGRTDLVMDVRRAFQRTLRDGLVAGVEEITGRRVIAFMSDTHADPDMAIEAFVLAPVAGQA